MCCKRCHGMMVLDRALDEIGRAEVRVWRCVACGEIIDPQILVNRTGKYPLGRKRYPPRPVFCPTSVSR
jgi:hypothetical protein